MGFIPKMARVNNPIIGFSKEDARRLHHMHNDALVVIDNGSSVDILYYPAFQQMRIKQEQLVPTNALLVRFGGTRIYPLSAATLSVTLEITLNRLRRMSHS